MGSTGRPVIWRRGWGVGDREGRVPGRDFQGARVGWGQRLPAEEPPLVSSLLPGEIQGPFPSGFAVETELRVPIVHPAQGVALSLLTDAGEETVSISAPAKLQCASPPFVNIRSDIQKSRGKCKPKGVRPTAHGEGNREWPKQQWGRQDPQGLKETSACSVDQTTGLSHLYTHTYACVHAHSHKHVHIAERIYHKTGYWLLLGSLIEVILIFFLF